MALQLSHRTTGGGAGVVGQLGMNGSEELEEGEASEANDSNSGDLSFPQIEDKLMEVLGHARKDFEGARYAEKLGCRYGLYGTFLPTHPVPVPPPPFAPPQGRRMPSPFKQTPVPLTPANQEIAKTPPKVPAEPEPKKPSSITLRIKVGSENRGKYSEIYNKLGFSSSPSVSEDDEDETASESPSRSPHTMLQKILSARLPSEGLLSPLTNGLLLPPREETRKIKIKKESSKETRDMEIDSKPVKQPDIRKTDTGRAVRGEDCKGKSQEQATSAGKSVAKRAESASTKQASRSNRDDSTCLEMADVKPSKSLEIGEGVLDKRKQKDAEPERLKKRHRPNSSSGSLEANSTKETKKSRKQAVSEDNPPMAKPKEEKKKPLKLTHSKAAPEVSDTAKRDQMYAPKEDDQRQKSKGGKAKVSRKNNYAELFGSDPADFSTMETKHMEPQFLPEPVVNPPVLINENWVQCELCHKWRLLPPLMNPPSDSDSWQCQMITWLPAGMNSCRIPEEETTARMYEIHGIQPPVDPTAAAASAAAGVGSLVPLPAAPLIPQEKPSSKSRSLDTKLGKHVAKKERPKHSAEVGEEFYSIKEADGKDMSKKKRRATADDQNIHKKLKAGETKRSDRKYTIDVSNENMEEERAVPRQNETKVQKRAVEKDKRSLDLGRLREEEREEQEVSKNLAGDDHVAKSVKPSKSSKSKAGRVAEHGRSSEQLIKVKSSTKQVHDTKKKGSRSPQATSPCNSFDVEFSNHDRDGKKNETRNEYDGASGHAEIRSSRSKPVLDEDNIRHNNASPLEDIDRRHYRDTSDRHRDGNDPDRSIDKWERRASNEGSHGQTLFRDDKSSKKNTKRSEGRGLENDRARLKEVDAVKAEQEEQKQEVCRVQTRKTPDDEAVRDIRREHDDKKDASAVIKDAKDLKHLADRLKDTDLYLQAGLKFMHGAALVPSVAESSQLYTDTAVLFKFCVSKYEQANDTVGAVLAYKCTAVARFRLLQLKNAFTSKDRTDVLAALRPPAPNQATPNGDSPSSSSASDLVDNLNSQEKILSSGGKGTVSPLFQGSTSTVHPQLLRLLKTSECVVEAFDSSGKADSLLAVLVSSKALSPEKLAAVEKVVQIGFGDVEKVVHLVNQALKALGR